MSSQTTNLRMTGVPTSIYSASVVRANWSEILKRVDSGEEVIVVRHGKPIVVISQYREESDDRTGRPHE